MAQDIRKLFKEQQSLEKSQLETGHEDRFLAKLEDELPANQRRIVPFWFIKAAASLVLLVSAGYFAYKFFKPTPPIEGVEVVDTQNQKTDNHISLGDISPDLKKIEDYYVTNINYELSQVDINDDNKQLFDSYMTKLSELNDEYKILSEELNKIGPNELTVNALIENLQLRLQLLYQLKKKLNELKEQNNEQIQNMQA